MSKKIKLPFLKAMGISALTGKDGSIILRKIGVTAEQIKKDPAFQRTRENAAEFGHAARTAHLIRRAFIPWYKEIADSQLSGRLVKTLMSLIQSDTLHPRGCRQAIDGKLQLLEGFDCNSKSKLAPYLDMPCAVSLQEKKRKLTLSLDTTAQHLKEAGDSFGATHTRITPIITAIDITGHTVRAYHPPQTDHVPLKLNPKKWPVIRVEATIDLPGDTLIIIAIAIQLYKYINGRYHLLVHSGSSSLKFIQVFRLT